MSLEIEDIETIKTNICKPMHNSLKEDYEEMKEWKKETNGKLSKAIYLLLLVLGGIIANLFLQIVK